MNPWDKTDMDFWDKPSRTKCEETTATETTSAEANKMAE
jgi:hypothetical protein